MPRRLVIAVAVVACSGAATRVTGPTVTMHDQASAIARTPDSYGTIGRAALVAGETIDSEAAVPGDRYPLNLRGLIGGKLCFTRLVDTGAPDEASRERFKASYAAARYAFALYGSLAEITDQTGWPEPPATDTFDVSVLDGRNLRGTCHSNENTRFCMENHREITLQLCAPLPALGPTANFLGLAIVYDDYRHNRFVAWKLTN